MTEPPEDPPEPTDEPNEPAEEVDGVVAAHEDGGTDLARFIARGLAGASGIPRSARGRTAPARGGRERRGAPPRRGVDGTQFSGAHPDGRDPQPLGPGLDRLVAEQGWATDLRVHGVFVHWAQIVGREVAEHVSPESYVEGRLAVRADSTAWATQITLLAGQVVKRINDELGDETVRVIDVIGPRTPSWVKGRLRVKGRGPRDTYG